MQHVLVVDDQAELCAAIQRTLEESGEFRVSCALGGDQALPILDDDRPALMVLDAVLTGMPGIELAVHATRRGIPIILTTGEPSIDARLDRLGWPHLRKPLPIERLLAECRATIEDARRNLRIVRGSLERLLKTSGEVGDIVEELRALRQRVAVTLAGSRRIGHRGPSA